MDLKRVATMAEELQNLASKEVAQFGIYREAQEEDAIVRANADGLLLHTAELLAALGRLDNPLGNNLIALDENASYGDPQADLRLTAIELFGPDVVATQQPRLRMSKQEYLAVFGCMVTLTITTICALAGAIWIGRWLWLQLAA